MGTMKDVFNANEYELDSFLNRDSEIKLNIKRLGVILIAQKQNLLNAHDTLKLGGLIKSNFLDIFKDEIMKFDMSEETLDRSKLGKPVIFNNIAYWYGPYDCLVPSNLSSCVYYDGSNILYKNGGVTQMHVSNPPNKSKWLETFTSLNHGLYFYK